LGVELSAAWSSTRGLDDSELRLFGSKGVTNRLAPPPAQLLVSAAAWPPEAPAREVVGDWPMREGTPFPLLR